MRSAAMTKGTNPPLPLGRQLREARRSAGLNAHELAHRAGLSTAAVYSVEGRHRGGRTRTLLKLVRALGLRLRMPDLAALAKDRGLSAFKVALVASVSFATARSVLADPTSGNTRSVERICLALGHPLNLVV